MKKARRRKAAARSRISPRPQEHAAAISDQMRIFFDQAKKHPRQYDATSYCTGGVFIQKTSYFFLASSASILAVVEMAHFFVWMRTRSSPVSKVMVSSVI